MGLVTTELYFGKEISKDMVLKVVPSEVKQSKNVGRFPCLHYRDYNRYSFRKVKGNKK